MQLNNITLAIAGIAIASTASAAVTVTPLVGYHYSEHDSTSEAQRKVFSVNDTDGISKKNSLQKGVAVGVELTPNAELQVEYGRNDEGTKTADGSDSKSFDMKQENVSANLLLGSSKLKNAKVEPYVLVGAGRSTLSVEDKQEASPEKGEEVAKIRDVVGNVGVGAKVKLNDALSLRGEARAVRNFDNKWWEGVALGGLEVKMGGKQAPVNVPAPVQPEQPKIQVMPKKPVDSDRDGVIDSRDACPGTTNQVVDSRGCPRKVRVDNKVKLELRVFFDNNRADIKRQFKPEIAKVARGMSAYPNSVARIEGHASKTGSARYNQRLSEARAVAVKSALSSEFGINPQRISTRGFGFDRPIASNSNAEGRAMNRRVYAIITGAKKGNAPASQKR